MSGLGKITLSATAIALITGHDRLPFLSSANAETVNNDVAILNAALGAEQEAVAAYQLGAGSGLLQKPIVDLAVQFQGHHKEHAAALAATVKSSAGHRSRLQNLFPSRRRSSNRRLTFWLSPPSSRKGQSAPIWVEITILTDRDLAKVAASILGDEAMHWAILRQALGQNPVPTAFLS